MKPLYSCTLETENTEHFFLRCQNKSSAGTSLMNELININNALNSTDLIRVILYGDKNLDVTKLKIITATFKLNVLKKPSFKLLIYYEHEKTSLVNIGNIFCGK